jgi:hypothetical protein
MNINITDCINIAANKFHETVDKFRCDLDRGVRYNSALIKYNSIPQLHPDPYSTGIDPERRNTAGQ